VPLERIQTTKRRREWRVRAISILTSHQATVRRPTPESDIMVEEHPSPSHLAPDSPSCIDLFDKEVTAVQLVQSDFNSHAGADTRAHQSAYAPDMNLSGGTECVEKPWAGNDTSWVPSALVPPASGLEFDDDMSVISGGREVTLDGGVHYVQEVCSDATALAFQQDDESFLGCLPDYLNVVSPIANPSNLTSFHEPQLGLDLRLGRLHSDVTMEASEASVCTPRVSNLHGHGKDTLWYKNFRALKEFKAEHGHTNVPQEYWKNPSLGNWVKYNRKKLREWHSNGSSDDMEKMTLLIEIGVVSYIGKGNAAKANGNQFTPRQVKAWEKQFKNLCKYREESGHCDVRYSETGKWKPLAEWVKRSGKVTSKVR